MARARFRKVLPEISDIDDPGGRATPPSAQGVPSKVPEFAPPAYNR